MPMLSPRALQGLKAYKYKPGGYTWMDHVHDPFWNYIVSKLPMWLAPNLITLTGLMALVVAYVANIIYLPGYEGEAPRWVYALSGFGLIFYLHLDCMDGKQARRTKSSSPLGQLFDHGCDALSLHFILANVQSALGVPCKLQAIAVVISVMVPWIVSHWEEYHTGILLYGNGWFGVLEANYITASVSFVSAAFGSGVWRTPLVDIVPIAAKIPSLQGVSLLEVFLVVAVLGSLWQVLCQLLRVMSFKPSALPADERGSKELGHWRRTQHLLMLFALLLVGLWWCWRTAEVLMLPGECRSVNACFGVAYAWVASQLIMDHMSKEPFRPNIAAYLALVMGAVNTYVRVVPTQTAAIGLIVLLTAAYLSYVVQVVREVTAYLGIYCLTLKPHANKE